MRIEDHRWHSERCGREMWVKRVGHWGPGFIYFPTCGGDPNEFFRYGMQHDIGGWIEGGKVQVFCVGSLNMETWYNGALHPYHRARWAEGYNQYILQEVVPFVRGITGNPFLGMMGASFGGYTVANLMLKRPDLFDLAVAMSGVFKVDDLLGGYHDDTVYFNSPLEYLRHMSDPWFYDRMRDGRTLWLQCGANDICRRDNDEFHDLLTWKGVPHRYDVWDPPCDHHEYWWKKMIVDVMKGFYNW